MVDSLPYVIWSLILLCFYLEVSDRVPYWWYTLRMTDWGIHKLLLGIRWCIRKITASIKALWHSEAAKTLRLVLHIPDLFRLVKWDVYYYLVRMLPFPYLYVKTGPRSFILYVGMLHWRVYFVVFFCLIFLYTKRYFFFLHSKLYDNFIAELLFNSSQPFSFFKFTFMLICLTNFF